MVGRAASACLLVLVALAGCSDPKDAPEGVPGALFDDATQGGDKGGIVGAVVDEAIRPIPNATVRLPGPGLSRLTAEDGSFSFLDVEPGAYRIVVTSPIHQPQETAVEVALGALAQVRIVLMVDAAKLPYNATVKMDGFAELTAAPFVGGLVYDLAHGEGATLCDCSFTLQPDPGAHGLVVEAVMADCPDTAGYTCMWNGFSYDVQNDVDGGIASDEVASGNNPLWLRITGVSPNATAYQLLIVPNTDPMPEVNKSFQVFTTFFYRADPPEDFRIVPPPA